MVKEPDPLGGTQHHRLQTARPSMQLRAALIRRMVWSGYRPETDGSSTFDLLVWLWKHGSSRLRVLILRSLAQTLERRRRKRPVLRPPSALPPDSSMTAWLKAHGHGSVDLPATLRRRRNAGEIALGRLRPSTHRRYRLKLPMTASRTSCVWGYRMTRLDSRGRRVAGSWGRSL